MCKMTLQIFSSMSFSVANIESGGYRQYRYSRQACSQLKTLGFVDGIKVKAGVTLISQSLSIHLLLRIRTFLFSLFSNIFCIIILVCTHLDQYSNKLTLAQWSISIPPENIAKTLVFRPFQEVWKWNIGLKLVRCTNYPKLVNQC